jgi:hypothetical protein
MSLIHEALRKARREPEQEDARGIAYARGLTGRRRNAGLGTGILIGALIAVAAGTAAGIGMWLWQGDRSRAQAAAPGSAAAQVDTASGLNSAASQPPAAPAATAAVATPAAAASAPTALPSGSGDRPGQRTPSVDQPGPTPVDDRPTPPPERATPRETRGPGGERVFHVEAELGYASLALDYIVARPSDPFARINGIDLRVGDTIEGFTVEGISATEVRLRDGRGPLILRVP